MFSVFNVLSDDGEIFGVIMMTWCLQNPWSRQYLPALLTYLLDLHFENQYTELTARPVLPGEHRERSVRASSWRSAA